MAERWHLNPISRARFLPVAYLLEAQLELARAEVRCITKESDRQGQGPVFIGMIGAVDRWVSPSGESWLNCSVLNPAGGSKKET